MSILQLNWDGCSVRTFVRAFARSLTHLEVVVDVFVDDLGLDGAREVGDALGHLLTATHVQLVEWEPLRVDPKESLYVLEQRCRQRAVELITVVPALSVALIVALFLACCFRG